MKIRKFVNRKEELNLLKSKLKSKNHEFIIIYGRRRIGKTTLLRKIANNSIFFTASKRKFEYNLQKFSETVANYLDLPPIKVKNFIEIFKIIPKNNIVIIDEFGYLIEKDEGVLSDFQEIVDYILPEKQLKLIICGSSISLFESRILNYKSPLYGRATLIMKINPLKFKHLFEWFDNNFETILKIYSVCGGIPKYLEFFKGKNIEKEIIENLFTRFGFLYYEATNLLREGLKDYSTYSLILEAIALGYTKITEIGNYCYLNPNLKPK